MSLACDSCQKSISPDGRHMTCSTCRQNYHLGKTCSGIAESTFAAMSPEKKEKWRCKACRSKCSRSDQDGNDASSEAILSYNSTMLAAQILEINRKLDSLLSLQTSVDSLLELPGKVNELLLLKPSIDLMKASVEEVQTSITSLGKKYDDLLVTTSAHETQITDLRDEVGALKATLSEHSSTISNLRTELNETDQHSRLQNMEIHGVKVVPGEALASTLVSLAHSLGIGHVPSDVGSVYRLPGKRAVTPPILVKFTSLAAKDRWMQARAKLRLLPCESPSDRVYFNDNLTSSNKELFWLARSRGKEHGYKFVWIRNARIYARKVEGAPAVRIQLRSDLDLII